MIAGLNSKTPKQRRLFGTCALGIVLALTSRPTVVHAQEPDAADPAPEESSVTFARMPIDQIEASLQEWLKAASADQAIVEQETTKWQDANQLAAQSGEEILDLVMESFAAADAAARKLLQESYGSGPIDDLIFDGVRGMPFFRNQVQLFRARWLTQHRYYDDAITILKELNPDDVIDPAGLLFYRALCQAELLQRRDALDSLTLLLNNTLDVPSRFRVVAELLQKDLIGRKEEGMDQIALMMKDVERRLDLGKSGEKTQGQEDAVIAALDKMLEEMDQQNQQQNGGGGGGSAQNQSGTQGAQDSMIKGSPAAGEADRKELKEGGKWGMMDQKAEARARELIRQKFPPNFLDQIGRYTRKIAEQKK